METSDETTSLVLSDQEKQSKIRNLIGFWFLGLCNNYSYVIMLSAAFDILHPKFTSALPTALPNMSLTSSQELSLFEIAENNQNGTKRCNPMSTGAILLADVIPSLLIKLLAPFIFLPTHLRVSVAILLTVSSFLLTSFSIAHWMSFLGVICAALSSGLGEVTILGYSSQFDKNVISSWSSGTGGAGVVGALSYAGLTKLLGPRTTLQVMLIIPLIMAANYFLLIVHPDGIGLCKKSNRKKVINLDTSTSEEDIPRTPNSYQNFTIREKILLVKPLLRYMVPLGLVYFAEYFINQGLTEQIFFQGIEMNHEEQYRWYQVVYQIGVLISRSSVNLIQIKRLWVLPILQMINAVFLLFVAYYMFLPSIWIVLVIILYEGLLGGAAYVNTFFTIIQKVEPMHKEFSMSVASLADSLGIVLAGSIAIPVHDALCLVPLK